MPGAGAGGGPQQASGPRIVHVERLVDPGRGGEPEPSLGEGAGLVEADGVDAAESLDGARRADEHTTVRQPAGRRQLRHRRDERKPLGHRGDGDADAGGERLPDVQSAQQAETRHGGAAGQGERQPAAGDLLQPGLHADRPARVRGES